jgi:DNA-binding response OmpR family regulator
MASGSTRRVLLVEDDAMLRNLIVRVLARRGIQADVAANGEEAIRLASLTDYSLIFLDLMLPLVGGLEVLQALKEMKPATPRIVIVVSAATDTYAHRLDPTVVHGVLAKPYDVDLLASLTEEIIRGDDVRKSSFPPDSTLESETA